MTGWERTIEERGGERRGDWCTAGEETWPCHEYIENYGNHRELDNLIMRREMTIARCNSKLRKMMAGGGWFRRASISRKWKLGGGRGEEEDEENLATTRNFSISQPLNMIFFFFFYKYMGLFFSFFWTNKLSTLGWNFANEPLHRSFPTKLRDSKFTNYKFETFRATGCLKITTLNNNVSIVKNREKFFTSFYHCLNRKLKIFRK